VKKNRLEGIFQARREIAKEEGSTPTPAQRETQEAGRSNPANKALYIHTSLYLSRKVHGDVRIALMQDGGNEDLSQLVDRLLEEWLDRRAFRDASA
jgi:hypothetical protein